MQVHPVCNANADGFASQNKNINSSSCSSRACAREGEGAADPFNPQIDPEWKKVYDAYEANIGPMPMGRSLELLTSYVEDMGAEVVVYAIELTNEAQPAAPAKFLRTVLEAFAQGGVRTLAEGPGPERPAPEQNGRDVQQGPAVAQPTVARPAVARPAVTQAAMPRNLCRGVGGINHGTTEQQPVFRAGRALFHRRGVKQPNAARMMPALNAGISPVSNCRKLFNAMAALFNQKRP